MVYEKVQDSRFPSPGNYVGERYDPDGQPTACDAVADCQGRDGITGGSEWHGANRNGGTVPPFRQKLEDDYEKDPGIDSCISDSCAVRNGISRYA